MSELKRYNVHSGHPDIDTWTEETTDGVWVDAEEAEADKAAALEQERERSRGLFEALRSFVTFHQGHVLPPELQEGMRNARTAIKAYEGLDKTGEQEAG